MAFRSSIRTDLPHRSLPTVTRGLSPRTLSNHHSSLATFTSKRWDRTKRDRRMRGRLKQKVPVCRTRWASATNSARSHSLTLMGFSPLRLSPVGPTRVRPTWCYGCAFTTCVWSVCCYAAGAEPDGRPIFFLRAFCASCPLTASGTCETRIRSPHCAEPAFVRVRSERFAVRGAGFCIVNFGEVFAR
jgi:hypothetical protein